MELEVARVVTEVVSASYGVIALPCLFKYCIFFPVCLAAFGGDSALWVTIAWYTVFDDIKADLLEDLYPNQEGTGKQGLGPYRGTEFHYMQAFIESPNYLTLSLSDSISGNKIVRITFCKSL